jgi:aspartate aminotransferase
MELSRRVRSLKPSSTVAVMNKAKALQAQGVAVLNFSAGEPDFNSPEKAKDAAIAALRSNQTKYLPAAGDQPTRDLIASILTTQNGIPHCTADHVVITTGVKMALYLTYQALFDQTTPGDALEMLLPVPAWVSFAPMAELAGAKVVELPTTAAGGFKITPEQLRKAITPRSRVLMLNSPSNPCSTMYTRAELEAIAQVVAEAAKSVAPHLCIVSDELYQNIVFGSVPFVSVGSIPSVAERTITINGPGKSFAMTGWRLGWVSGSGAFGKEFAGAIIKLAGQTTTCVPAFELAGMRVALTQCAEDLETMRQAFARRAELIYSLLSQIPNLPVAKPIGAFYVFPDLAAYLGKTTPSGKTLATPADFAAVLLEEQLMAVVPGEDFGGVGRHSFRMSFACSEDQIREGVARLGKFLASLR